MTWDLGFDAMLVTRVATPCGITGRCQQFGGTALKIDTLHISETYVGYLEICTAYLPENECWHMPQLLHTLLRSPIWTHAIHVQERNKKWLELRIPQHDTVLLLPRPSRALDQSRGKLATPASTCTHTYQLSGRHVVYLTTLSQSLRL
jgi:hypothetical protein